MKNPNSPFINKKKKTIEFHIVNTCAHHISVAGSFNHWARDEYCMEPKDDGTWTVEIPLPPKGRYHYKFYIDDQMAMEDIENPLREPDGVTGWNSILTV